MCLLFQECENINMIDVQEEDCKEDLGRTEAGGRFFNSS